MSCRLTLLQRLMLRQHGGRGFITLPNAARMATDAGTVAGRSATSLRRDKAEAWSSIASASVSGVASNFTKFPAASLTAVRAGRSTVAGGRLGGLGWSAAMAASTTELRVLSAISFSKPGRGRGPLPRHLSGTLADRGSLTFLIPSSRAPRYASFADRPQARAEPGGRGPPRALGKLRSCQSVSHAN